MYIILCTYTWYIYRQMAYLMELIKSCEFQLRNSALSQRLILYYVDIIGACIIQVDIIGACIVHVDIIGACIVHVDIIGACIV